jgi:3(or 17)beta-hydroxysteroid dehydrogenase
MAGRLSDKFVLVTGAAQGIGAAIAGAMAREGATVVFTDLLGDAAHEAASKVKDAIALSLDVTKESGWSEVAEEIGERYGRLDVLVNNAGVDFSRSIEETSFDDWRRLMSVNLDSIFLGCRAMLPLLRKGAQRHEGGASVINLSSVAGIVGYPDQVAYNVSKAAVAHAAKSLAIEWAHHRYNIRANSIHPGAILTQMVEEHVATQVARGKIEAEVWQAITDMAPLGRLGRVSDVASAAVYLASEEAAFVNATGLVVDGGFIAR